MIFVLLLIYFQILIDGKQVLKIMTNTVVGSVTEPSARELFDEEEYYTPCHRCYLLALMMGMVCSYSAMIIITLIAFA